MIKLISPQEISQEKSLIKNSQKFNVNYLDINSPIGWNYVLDHIWFYKEIKNYINENQLSNPLVFDVGCGSSPFYKILEGSLNIKVIGIDRPEGFCHLNHHENAVYNTDFLKLKEVPENSVDIIYWLSSIEHNKINMIKKLYKKSKYFLKKGGLLLITFPVSKTTYWFEPSQQTNLSLEDAKKVFNDNEVVGDFDKIHREFRKNILLLKDKYQKRYGHFNHNDPEFIVGGVKQIMPRNTFLGL
jgi:predicted SAM-dependent methyltransferase